MCYLFIYLFISGGFTVGIGEADTTKDSQLASAKVDGTAVMLSFERHRRWIRSRYRRSGYQQGFITGIGEEAASNNLTARS
jgi:hypothetical protein